MGTALLVIASERHCCMVKDDILILDTTDIQSRLIILILSHFSSIQTSYRVRFLTFTLFMGLEATRDGP